MDNEEENYCQEDAIMISNMRVKMDEEIALGISSAYQDNIQIAKDGIIINPNSNNGFMTAGVYEVHIIKRSQLLTEVKLESGVLKGSVKKVIRTGSGVYQYEIFDIPKSSLGGTTGFLILSAESKFCNRFTIN